MTRAQYEQKDDLAVARRVKGKALRMFDPRRGAGTVRAFRIARGIGDAALVPAMVASAAVQRFNRRCSFDDGLFAHKRGGLTSGAIGLDHGNPSITGLPSHAYGKLGMKAGMNVFNKHRVPMIGAVVMLAATSILAAGQATAPPGAAVVRVAAAADLKFALDDIAARLAKREPAIRVQPTYGSSGVMHAQLRQRAPHDVFLSADIDYPRDLVSKGIGSDRDLFTYATGRIVVWVSAASGLSLERDGLRALTGARRIAIANPRHAPYGRAAEAALRSAGVWAEVNGRLVLGENVAQAAQFAQSGAADAGIIAKSVALTPAMRKGGRSWDVPDDAYEPLTQGGLILPWAASRDAAVRFRDYLLGDEGRQVLASYGFGAPGR
jgi:molybdate transport system substrate-binding protein